MRIAAWLSLVLVLLAGGEALAQPVCDAGGLYSGLINKPIQFDGTGSSSPGGTIVSYFWIFGDGTTGTGPTPEHTYQDLFYFDVTLTVIDSNQQSSSCATSVYVGYDESTPVCDAGGPYSGVVNQTLEFDGSGSSAPGGSIVAYDWDFGDGSTGTGTTPTHAYAAPGIYVVTLTVTDDQGTTSTCTSEAVIMIDEPGTPICDADGPYNGTINQPVQFDGSGSSDPKGGIVLYVWDFGDGATGTGATPQHTYADPDFYTVYLTVHDERGGMSTCETVADISPLPVEPSTWGRIKSRYR
jgi:PKD repeat protein